MARPEIDEIVLGGEAAAWEALGFAVCDGVIALGGVRLRLAGGGARGCEGGRGRGGGIVGWSLRGLPPEGVDLDGLEAGLSDAEVVAEGAEGAEVAACEVAHPLGAVAVDHLVALTPDFDRTLGKLRAAGLDYRGSRVAGGADDRSGGGLRQAFFVLGPCLLELGGPAEGDVRFWGLTLVVSDPDAAAARLGSLLGEVRDAVQPGRRIATVRAEAGLGLPVALMSPR